MLLKKPILPKSKRVCFVGYCFVISPQVVIETHHVILRKYKIPPADFEQAILFLLVIGEIEPIYYDTIQNTVIVKREYSLSFLDSVILSSPLQAGCDTLYLEDM